MGMIVVDNLGVSFSGNVLFEDVNLKFVPGECYGLIGANGAGKSTFLKVMSGDVDSTSGAVHIPDGCRLSMLRQDHFAYESHTVLDTVLMGHKPLYAVYEERMRLYDKAELTDAEGERIGELEALFGEMDGYVAESDAATMLADLGISTDKHDKPMAQLDGAEKVRVLLAQALFGDPDVLLLDEPTNQLDYLSVLWLEKFIMDFKNTVIVVSHDRHFLNKVCTYIADVDFGQIKLYPGNYDFWKQSSELIQQQQQDKKQKDEKKIQELEAFVRRFSANASKSKQATSRKKMIEKLRPDEMPTSRRRSPFIHFKPFRSCGNRVLTVKNLSASVGGDPVLKDVSFTLEKDEKLAIVGQNGVSKTALLDVLAGELTPDAGLIEWGDTIRTSYFPKDNTDYFKNKMSIMDWLSSYQDSVDNEALRGFLGRMLFSGDDAKKNVQVLSGGEKARAMFSRMMMADGNVLLFDEPTNHLDLEAISAINTALEVFDGGLILTSHDFQLLNTVPNRIIEVSPYGMIDRRMDFDSYMQDERVAQIRQSWAVPVQ